MTCRKVRRALPLLAGGDLPARQERKLQAHVEGCAFCRKELEEYRFALGRIKSAARVEGAGEWSEGEWKALMARITSDKAEKKPAALGLRPRWALASGLAAVVLLAALAYLFRDSIFKPGTAAPGGNPSIVKKEEPKGAPGKPDRAKPPAEKGQPVPVVQPEYLARNAGKVPPAGQALTKAAAAQDIVTVKMVSQETGLQVVWFFNRNFDWKGDQK